jgi:nucleotide-binding universal stress UspA family protein
MTEIDTERIVVGLDGSAACRSALVWASHLAVRRDAVIEPALSWQYPVSSMTALGSAVPTLPRDEMQAAAMTDLALFLVEYGPDLASGVQLGDHHVAEGPPGEALCRIAEGADLLVVGSRGLGGFRGLMLGSVSAHCANAAPCAVGIVPEGHVRSTDAHDVVVGIDGSDNSVAALRWANAWADSNGTLRVVHAWSAVMPYSPMSGTIDPSILETAAEKLVVSATQELDQGFVTECVNGDARQQLTVRAAGSDMLVIGARGHSGLTRLLTGSVASSVVHHLTCPVVVVPAD